MSNKISLVYENGEYSVNINGTLMNKGNDVEEMFENFQKVIRNNSIRETTSWDYTLNKVKALKLDNIEINEEYKTITFDGVKYFHNINKLFNIKEGNMTELINGYSLFMFILQMNKEGYLEGCNDIIEICELAIKKKATYRNNDTTFTVASAKFNYGVVEYNFTTGKINKGVAIEKATFNEFKEYVKENLN